MVYARFGRTRKGSGTMRRGYSYRSRRRSYVKTTRRPARKLKMATVGYLKDLEVKYTDTTWVGTTWTPQIISYEQTPGTPASAVVQGIKYMSNLRASTGTSTSQNMVSGVFVGSQATNRVGNRIKGRWLQCGVTLEAAKSPVQQFGEQVNVEGAVTSAQYYMKTNYRIVIVKDKQVNNTTNTINWGDVFGIGLTGVDGTSFAGGENRDIPNMGRFELVKQVRCTVDGDMPMKNVQIGCPVGYIRYSGGNPDSLTNVGYYMLIGQDVLGTANSAAYVIAGNVRVTARFSFTDD